jgi:hypothetical protein
VFKAFGQAVRGLRGAGQHGRTAFIGGVQRSGTNMIMDVLDLSPDTRVYHERDKRAFERFELRDLDTLAQLRCSGARCTIFKALCDNHSLTELMSAFRPSQTIWVYRHYEDVVASHHVAWPDGRNQIDALVKDRAAAGWRGRGMTDSTWALVRKHYHRELNKSSAQALFWYYRNQLFFDQRLDQDARVQLVRYESFTADSQSEIEKLGRFLDIRVTPEMVAHVSGARKTQASNPIEPPIREICDDMLQRLGVAGAERKPASIGRSDPSSSHRDENCGERSRRASCCSPSGTEFGLNCHDGLETRSSAAEGHCASP